MKQMALSLTQLLLSVFIWLFIAVVTVLAFTAIAVVHLFDRDQRLSQRIANMWGKSIVSVNPLWRIHITGRHHIKKNKGYVLVANHMSLADIVCIYCLDKPFRWIAKASLFKIPFLKKANCEAFIYKLAFSISSYAVSINHG